MSLTLIFVYEKKTMTIQCQEDEKIDNVFNRFCIKAGLNPKDPVFYFNSKELKKCGKSLFALGIGNRATFNVVIPKYVTGAGILEHPQKKIFVFLPKGVLIRL